MTSAIIPPKPDDLAVAFAAALLGSGKYGDDFGAAIHAAWAAVPHFYVAREFYATSIAPMFLVSKEPDDTQSGWMA